MNPTLIIFLLAIIVVGILIFVAILVGQSRGRHGKLDRDAYQTDWLIIENSLARDNPASYQVAVMDADKLLDKALRDLGYHGQSMGDRLKRAGNRLNKSALDAAWSAHKVRNRLAHESGVHLSYDDTRRALNDFKTALKGLGAV